MIKAGIIGAAGYTAGELIRILLNHPDVEIAYAQSSSQAGLAVSAVHQDLIGETHLAFSGSPTEQADVVFFCSGHGKSHAILEQWPELIQSRIIDLGSDFRLKKDASLKGMNFVYGLCEVKKKQIKEARYIANPGCFATAIQLALAPLAVNGKLENQVHINAITGSTGAGQNPSATTHFSWRNNNVSVYKAFGHQHLGEIGETLQSLQNAKVGELNFIPVRGNFTRGIFCTAYTEVAESLETCKKWYSDYYQSAPFVRISESEIHLKQVVGTNNCLIQLQKHGNKLLITSIIDNLLKGASGQAVQNMNLLFGLEETVGLKLKALAF